MDGLRLRLRQQQLVEVQVAERRQVQRLPSRGVGEQLGVLQERLQRLRRAVLGYFLSISINYCHIFYVFNLRK